MGFGFGAFYMKAIEWMQINETISLCTHGTTLLMWEMANICEENKNIFFFFILDCHFLS